MLTLYTAGKQCCCCCGCWLHLRFGRLSCLFPCLKIRIKGYAAVSHLAPLARSVQEYWRWGSSMDSLKTTQYNAKHVKHSTSTVSISQFASPRHYMDTHAEVALTAEIFYFKPHENNHAGTASLHACPFWCFGEANVKWTPCTGVCIMRFARDIVMVILSVYQTI